MTLSCLGSGESMVVEDSMSFDGINDVGLGGRGESAS